MSFNFKNKKIGIWGFGIVGKSLFRFFSKFTEKIDVFDLKEIAEVNISQNHDLSNFLESNEIIVPSPGIDIRSYRAYKDKFFSEIDIFQSVFSKEVIAVTGTVGKTTLVNLIHQIYRNLGKNVGLGGNVGFAMLDLLDEEVDTALLEVSSFQLENSKIFAPNLAIWSNFSPNHLDRHSSTEEYFLSKLNLIRNQKENQIALLPLDLIEKIRNFDIKSTIYFFTEKLDIRKLNFLKKNEKIFFIEDGFLKIMSHNSKKNLFKIEDFPEISFLENWIIVFLAFYLRNIKLREKDFVFDFKVPEHRLEKFAEYKGAVFYNDSKSTVPESTLNAIKKLNSNETILILGGLSKGINRSDLIKNCVGKIKKVYVFGSEAKDLKKLCDQYNLLSVQYSFLNDVVRDIFLNLTPNDKILFSPAGSSYDLFENYQERGKEFKNLVMKYISKN